MATEAKPAHTPGPWATARGFEGQTVVGSDGVLVADCSIIDRLGQRTGPECTANARLIAAAPDLLEALKAVVAIADRRTVEFDAAHAAIAKAEGAA